MIAYAALVETFPLILSMHQTSCPTKKSTGKWRFHPGLGRTAIISDLNHYYQYLASKVIAIVSNQYSSVIKKVLCKILHIELRYGKPSDALSMFTTSIRSKWITTPPLVPQGTFLTSSVCIVTCTLRNDVTKGTIMWNPGPLVDESKAPPWQRNGSE